MQLKFGIAYQKNKISNYLLITLVGWASLPTLVDVDGLETHPTLIILLLSSHSYWIIYFFDYS
jgi:hypothetical protein